VDPITELEGGQWRRGAVAVRLDAALRSWGGAEPALAPFAGSAERLFRFLRSATNEERDAVLCALLRIAKNDQLAGMVVLEALLPGLKALVRRLLLDASQRDEVWAVVFASVWERICRYPVERRPARVAANLLLDSRHAALRALGRKPGEPATLPLDPQVELVEPVGPGRHEDVIVVLRRAVQARAISAEEARLILYTRIDGRSLTGLAAEADVPYDALRIRRRRAERRLLLFLGEAAVRFEGRNRHICTARTDTTATRG
jgi:DNA-directed RNA polymerase specialized sigma24 family protein